MEGYPPQLLVTIQRTFAPTRLSDDWLAQAYEHVLRRVQQLPTPPNRQAARPTRRRKRRSSVATTGGRKT